MRILGRDEKTPAEAVAYTHDCTPDLNGSTISGTPVWTVSPETSPALTKDTQSNTTLTATVRYSAGKEGTLYTVTLTIVTAAGETLQAAHEILVVA